MRATMKGFLKLKALTIPIKLYSGTKDNSLNFNLLHEPCRSKVNYELKCSKCGKTISRAETVKGFKVDEENFVILTEQEIKSCLKDKSETIEIEYFTDIEKIDIKYFSDLFYLFPDKIGKEAFSLLFNALVKSKKSAIAKFITHGRERKMAILPEGSGLCCYVLRCFDEVKKAEEIEKIEQVEIEPKMIEMMSQIIASMDRNFEIEKVEDEYTKAIVNLVEAKLKGEEIKVEEKKEKEATKDLENALMESLKMVA